MNSTITMNTSEGNRFADWRLLTYVVGTIGSVVLSFLVQKLGVSSQSLGTQALVSELSLLLSCIIFGVGFWWSIDKAHRFTTTSPKWIWLLFLLPFISGCVALIALLTTFIQQGGLNSLSTYTSSPAVAFTGFLALAANILTPLSLWWYARVQDAQSSAKKAVHNGVKSVETVVTQTTKKVAKKATQVAKKAIKKTKRTK